MITTEDISVSIRLLVIWSGYCYLFLNFMGRVLGNIRSTFLQWVELMIKGLVINVGCGIFLGRIFAGQIWWEVFYSLLIILYSLSVFWVHYYTYYGSFLKVNLMAMCTELNYVVFLPFTMILINILGKRPYLFDYMVPLEPVDLLYPLMIAGLFEIEYRIMKEWIPKLRAYEPSHRKIWWSWLLVYVCGGMISTIFLGLKTIGRLNIGYYAVPVFFIMILLSGLIWMTIRYQKTVQEKRQFLKAQQKMMQLHYDVILRQAEGLEQNRREIERQMESLMAADAGQIAEERIRHYLAVLTGQYEQIQAGVYCRDMLADAVLYHLAARFRQRKIPFEFSFQDYDRGKIEETDIAEILMNIQKLAEKETMEKICLKAGCVKEDLILEMTGPTFKKCKWLKKQMLPVVAKYDGDIWIQKENGTFYMRLRKERYDGKESVVRED